MVLTAMSEATSPALWPPIPSATTKRPRLASTRSESSFVGRRPGWVAPWAASDMRHDYSVAPLYTLYPTEVATGPLFPTLARASAALERGRGAEAAALLQPLLRSQSYNREDELQVRAALAEAWLLQDDLGQAT